MESTLNSQEQPLHLAVPEFPAKRTGHATVLGGGPTGLSTAWRLAKHGWKVTILEKDGELGGHGGTRKLHGYDVDDGPHKLYPQVDIAKQMIEHFVGGELLTISKKSTIYLNGKYIPFPFGLVDLFKGLGVVAGIRCGISYVLGKIQKMSKGKIKTYTDYVVSLYGRYPHELVFRQIARKQWGNPDWLDVKLAETRIIAPNLLELLKSLFQGGIKNKPKLSADEFYYPRKGLRQLWEAMWAEIEQLGGELKRSTVPVKIIIDDTSGYRVQYKTEDAHEDSLKTDAIISTIPLRAILPILDPQPPAAVTSVVEELQATSLMILYLVINTPRVLPVNWIFFPEDRLHFGRLSEQKGFSPEMIPGDRTVLLVEIPFARPEIQSMDREQLIRETIEQLHEIGILKPEHTIIDQFTAFDQAVYPKYDLAWKANLRKILDYTDSLNNFYLNGRHGLFCYNNMDHSMEMGVKLADHMTSGRPITDWQPIRETFYDYRIVD